MRGGRERGWRKEREGERRKRGGEGGKEGCGGEVCNGERCSSKGKYQRIGEWH